MTYLIKVSKAAGLRTQQLCGCSTKEELRQMADKTEKALLSKYDGRYAVKREFCVYHEPVGVCKGFHFTLL